VLGAFKTEAAKSCFINDMVKKHLPVTKPVARNANKVHALFSCRSSGGCRARTSRSFPPIGPSLAGPPGGRY